MALRIVFLASVMLASAISAPWAQSPSAPDLVALGKAEAIEHCARCHPGLRSGRAGRVEATTFRALTRAKDDATAEAALNAILVHGHAGLDAERFSHAELGALAAYLRSLKW